LLFHFEPLCPITYLYSLVDVKALFDVSVDIGIFAAFCVRKLLFLIDFLIGWFFIVLVYFFRQPSISPTQGVLGIFSNQAVGHNFNLELSLFLILQG